MLDVKRSSRRETGQATVGSTAARDQTEGTERVATATGQIRTAGERSLEQGRQLEKLLGESAQRLDTHGAG